MNNFCKKEDILSLEELITSKRKKDKYFIAFLIASICYVLAALFNLNYDMNNDETIQFDWKVALPGLILPAFGILFHMLEKKIGWIINSLYYVFMASVAIGTLIVTIIKEKNFHMGSNNLQAFLLLFFALASILLLFTKSVRAFFRINRLTSFFVPGISLGVATAVFILILHS